MKNILLKCLLIGIVLLNQSLLLAQCYTEHDSLEAKGYPDNISKWEVDIAEISDSIVELTIKLSTIEEYKASFVTYDFTIFHKGYKMLYEKALALEKGQVSKIVFQDYGAGSQLAIEEEMVKKVRLRKMQDEQLYIIFGMGISRLILRGEPCSCNIEYIEGQDIYYEDPSPKTLVLGFGYADRTSSEGLKVWTECGWNHDSD